MLSTLNYTNRFDLVLFIIIIIIIIIFVVVDDVIISLIQVSKRRSPEAVLNL